jgi:dihydrolipoamide dehydrogenase
MMAHKDAVVKANVDGVAFLFKKNKIDFLHGSARIAGASRVDVALAKGGSEAVDTKAIVIATGSESTPLPGVPIDEERVVTSTGALELKSVPKRLLIVGAGVIGLEIGSVWRRLGSEVTVVEFLDRILPGFDAEIAKQSQRIFQKQGFAFRLASKVTGVERKGDALSVSVAPAKGDGASETLQADVVLVAIGRRPHVEGLRLKEAGVALDERGRVKTDAHFKTNVDGIYAIGDAIAGPMLAHTAEDEGSAVAEILAGQAGHVNYGVIPSVVYTMPEIAILGRGEEELKEAGIEYKVGKFPFTANARARAMNHTDGFVKVIVAKADDSVLGVHILGASAGELIQEAAVLMEFGGSAEDLARTTHSHPTMSEAVREAAMAAWFKPIHI